MGGEGSRMGKLQRVDTQPEERDRLKMSMESGEKMEYGFQVEH